MPQIKKSINELLASAINKKTSPMQWIESEENNEVIAFLRADDYQDFCFICSLNEDNGLLTINDYTLDDESIELSATQLSAAQNAVQWLYDGSQPSQTFETEHGLRNSDFISDYA